MVLVDVGTAVHNLTGHSAIIDQTMRVAADYLVYAAIVIFGLLWVHREGLRAGVAVALGSAAALGVGALLSAMWFESRPFVVDHFAPLIAHGPDAAFPSDHLLLVGAMTGAIWLPARRLALVTAGVALIVAVARVYVGVHYPLDVGAGGAIGAVCGLLAWSTLALVEPLLNRIDRRLQSWRLRPVLLGLRGRPGSGEPTARPEREQAAAG